MKINKSTVQEDRGRDLFWVKIFFEEESIDSKTRVFACAPQEYFEELHHLPGGQKITEQQLDDWVDSVVEKWSKLGQDIFSQDTHFDVYYSTPEGEKNGLNFLLKQM